MPMNRRILVLAAAAGLFSASGCDLSKLAGTTSAISTTQSIWISASWSGGRTGTPLESKGVTPNNLNGSYCPANSVQLYNHGSPIPGWTNVAGLMIRNTCTSPVHYLICSTSGGSQVNSIPKCSIDPRQTPPGNMLTIDLGESDSKGCVGWVDRCYTYVANTQLDAGVNVFYCPTDSQFTLGVVDSDAPTDCWKP
jgi:hypothetical protein